MENAVSQEFQGKDVYVKASYNSAHPFPATTHPDGLRALVALLREEGCIRIALIERSGMGHLHGMFWQSLAVPRLALGTVSGNDRSGRAAGRQWIKRVFAGSHWKQGFEMPRFLEQETPAVQLCNLKTHRFGATSVPV